MHKINDPASPTYWINRRRAFAVIRRIEQALLDAARAPSYVRGSRTQEDDYEVVENTAPFDHLCDLQSSAASDPVVVSILMAQNRLSLLDLAAQ